jgi:NAD(P)-dependent dehydrogenase (short-subunit alcohol dehydrogenase family)
MGTLLKGLVAVITGSGSGIGRGEAKAMAAQGAKVVVNDIGTSSGGIGLSHAPADSVVKEIRDAGGSAIANYDSVAIEKEAENIIKTAIDNFGRIDILVNNAGVVREPNDVFDLSSEEWELLIKTHLFGTFYCTRYACSFMKKQGSGKIINTSSHTGFGWKGFAAYSAAKEGITGFSRTVARDMAGYGVNCNVIRPLAAWRGSKELSPEIAPLRPEDIASMVVYLASEQANQINGCIFEVWRGHVGIFQDPPPVANIIKKEGPWTVEELIAKVPESLTKNKSRQVFPEVLHIK